MPFEVSETLFEVSDAPFEVSETLTEVLDAPFEGLAMPAEGSNAPFAALATPDEALNGASEAAAKADKTKPATNRLPVAISQIYRHLPHFFQLIFAFWYLYNPMLDKYPAA